MKVKRKGQMTIPVGLREKFNLHEGSLLGVEARDNAILLRPVSPLQAGKVVRKEAVDIRQLFGKYKFRDLQFAKDELREGWH